MGVRQVSGPGETPESDSTKKKKGVDSDAFKEMMKVGKIREVDPEEQRKRKSQYETEEDLKAAAAQAPEPSPQMGSSEGDEDQFKLTLGESTGAAAAPTGAEGAAYEAPEEEPWEEYPWTPPTFQPTSYEQSTGTPEVSEGKKPSGGGEEKAPQKAAPKGKKKTPAQFLKDQKAAALKAPKKEQTPEQKFLSGETKPPTPSEKKEAFFDQLAKPLSKQEKEQEKQAEQVMEGPPPIAAGGWEVIKAPEKEKKESLVKEVSQEGISLGLSGGSPELPGVSIEPTSTAPYTFLHPQVMEIYDRMVGVMTVMTSTGVTRTTIELTAPQFASSKFFGTEIVISEYSTAPKAFNIELRGSPQAVALFQENAEELVAAFQGGGYNFRVNRIEASLIPQPRLPEKKGRVAPVKKPKEEGS